MSPLKSPSFSHLAARSFYARATSRVSPRRRTSIPGRTTKDGRAAVQPLPSLPERWKPPCDGTPRPAAASTHAEAAWLCRPGVALQQLLRSDSEKAAAEAHAVKEAAGAYRKGRWSATALRALPAPARLGRTIIESRLGLSTIRLLAGAHAPHESRATDHARRKPLREGLGRRRGRQACGLLHHYQAASQG